MSINSSGPVIQDLAQKLCLWYKHNQRALPWRQNRDPYRIWLSEVMLQQTTVQAVIPYYERFLQKFPTLKNLAQAPLSEVNQAWSGLGYYSRARNLHSAAQTLLQTGFPQTAEELLQLPGFGPYTSRAVASLAFGEQVGVLDGNVIRVLSRVFGKRSQWWLPKQRQVLQAWSDQLAKAAVIEGKPQSADLNQGLMELGATICTPQNPSCLLCPWQKNCQAFAKNLQGKLPLKKPRKEIELWLWQPLIIMKKNKIALISNDYAPFLKKQLIFPGYAKKISAKPRKFSFHHSITHHQIFVQPSDGKSNIKILENSKWISAEELADHNPSSLLTKTLAAKKLVSFALIFFCLLSTFLGCSSGGNKTTVIDTVQSSAENKVVIPPPQQELGSPLMTGGNELLMDLSHDGEKVLFISSDRLAHHHRQLYEFFLPLWKEKRVTYSDGNVESAAWSVEKKTDQLFYTSPTDRLKENLFADKTSATTPSDPQENDIFESDSESSFVQKITQAPAFYSHLQSIKGAESGLVFFKENEKKTEYWQDFGGQISRLNLPPDVTSMQISTLLKTKNGNIALLAKDPLDMDGKIIFLAAGKFKSNLLQSEHPGWKWIAPWNLPLNQWLAVRRNEITHRSQVVILDIKNLCAQELISSSSEILKALGEPQSLRLVLEVKKGDKHQIFSQTLSGIPTNLPGTECSGEKLSLQAQ